MFYNFFIYSTLALLMLLFSSTQTRVAFSMKKLYKNKLKDNSTKACYILGNCLALNDALNDFTDRKDVSLYVFNFFANQDVYFDIKPENYIFIDPCIWINTHPTLRDENALKQFFQAREKLINNLKKTDWEMNLFVSASCPKHFFDDFPANIHVIRLNIVPVQGWRFVRHFLYRAGLGLPNPINVSIAAIYSAINLGYKNIYLYGLNHSWMLDFRVDEQNRLYTEDSHFYKNKIKRYYLPKGALEKSLRCMADAFSGHQMLEEYSQSRDCKIYNRTKGSFVDAYEFDNAAGK